MEMDDKSFDEEEISQYSPYFNPFYQYLIYERKKAGQMNQLQEQQLKKENLEKQRLKKQLNAQQSEKANKQINLFKHKYHRVIIDEAHNIKARQTLQSKSAIALDADYR